MIVKDKAYKEEFEPITIEVTFQTLEEFKHTMHRFNASVSSIKEGTSDLFDDGVIFNYTDSDIYHVLNEIARKRGYIA